MSAKSLSEISWKLINDVVSLQPTPRRYIVRPTQCLSKQLVERPAAAFHGCPWQGVIPAKISQPKFTEQVFEPGYCTVSIQGSFRRRLKNLPFKHFHPDSLLHKASLVIGLVSKCNAHVFTVLPKFQLPQSPFTTSIEPFQGRSRCLCAGKDA